MRLTDAQREQMMMHIRYDPAFRARAEAKVGRWEAARYLQQLASDPDAMEAVQRLARENLGRLGDELTLAGLAPTAVAYVLNGVSSRGLDAVGLELRHEALTYSTREVVERASQATGSERAKLLSDAAENAAANELYWRTGRLPAPGSSALSELRALVIAHRDAGEPIEGIERMLAKEYGVPLADVQRFASRHGTADMADRLVSSLKAHDREHAKPQPKPTGAEVARERSSKNMRDAIGAKFDEHRARDEAVAAKRNSRASREAPPSQPAPDTRTPRERLNDSYKSNTMRALEAAADRLERGEPASEPVRAEPEQTTMRQDMEAKWDQMESAEEVAS